MTVEMIVGSELDTGLIECWHAIRDSNPALESPFFCPEYTLAVAGARNDVFIGIMREAGRITGFFPFQRTAQGIGKPVGGLLTDYQGAIVLPDAEWSAAELLRGCGLKTWEFNHLIASQNAFQPHFQRMEKSHVITLDNGFDAYVEEMRKHGHRNIHELFRKQRKFVREHGGFDFELCCDDGQALRKVFEWKSAQCRRTGTVDYFNFNWTRDMVEKIHHTRTPRFSGLLTVLSHHGQVIAAHFGMRAGNVLHYWFPVYGQAYSDWSPGKMLLLKMCEQGVTQGLTRIDLGKGEDVYKRGFANDGVALAEGGVYGSSAQAQAIRIQRQLANSIADSRLRKAVRESPAFARIRPPLRFLRRAIGSASNWIRV